MTEEMRKAMNAVFKELMAMPREELIKEMEACELNIFREDMFVGKSDLNEGLSLREPDCAAVDCQYNAEARCKARPFITVNSKGECLDYDVLTDEEIEMLTGKAR